jgi:hypothetical protein
MFAAILLFAALTGGYLAFQPAFGANSVDGIVHSWINGGAFGTLDQFQVNSSGELNQIASSSLATTTVDAFTEGGAALATTTTTTSFGTFTEAQLLTNTVITLTPNVSSATSTLPATSTMTTLLPNTGDSRTWLLINGTSTAAKTVGLALGTGIDVQSNTLNNVQIAPLGSAEMRCTRLSTRDVQCRVNILIVGD